MVRGQGLQTLRDKKLRRKGKVCKLPIQVGSSSFSWSQHSFQNVQRAHKRQTIGNGRKYKRQNEGQNQEKSRDTYRSKFTPSLVIHTACNGTKTARHTGVRRQFQSICIFCPIEYLEDTVRYSQCEMYLRYGTDTENCSIFECLRYCI